MKTGFPRRAPAWAMLAAGLVLTGCGTSPPQTFHLLTRYAADVSPPQAGERAYGIAIGSIGLPDAVARPQLVISETGSRLAIREQQRWAEPLAADIGRALAENLAQALPEAYVYSQAASAATALPPRFRVSVDVQRFESRLRGQGAGAVLDTAWTVTELSSGRRQACRTLIRAPLRGRGYDGLVAAHQDALARLGERIGAMVAGVAAGQPVPATPADSYCQRPPAPPASAGDTP